MIEYKLFEDIEGTKEISRDEGDLRRRGFFKLNFTPSTAKKHGECGTLMLRELRDNSELTEEGLVNPFNNLDVSQVKSSEEYLGVTLNITFLDCNRRRTENIFSKNRRRVF